MIKDFNTSDSPTVFLLTSLIWVRLLAVCLPCPLHTWCQSWRGQDQEGPPVRPECCTHMCHGISPRCHLCGWWCRWTRRWCPSASWRRCGTGSSHIWHHCWKKRLSVSWVPRVVFQAQNSACSWFIYYGMWPTKLQQIILSARRWLAKFLQWRVVCWASLHYLTENSEWMVLNEENKQKNIHIRLFSSPFLALDIIAMCVLSAVPECVSCCIDILEACIMCRPCTWTNHIIISHVFKCLS